MSEKNQQATLLAAQLQESSPEILAMFLDPALSDEALIEALREHVALIMQEHYPKAWAYYTGEEVTEENYYKLVSTSMAFMRL
ncbi:MAG: KamA family protein, partial [Spirochaetales bacterium]|nr:KamA family protein [Spirochaetales bacterium]